MAALLPGSFLEKPYRQAQARTADGPGTVVKKTN